MNNHRIAIWSDIEQAILQRIVENKARMKKALLRDTSEDVFAALNRIAIDDEERLIAARSWIAHHRREV